MKEYRLVCSRDEHWNSTGRVVHHEVASPTCIWGEFNRTYEIREEAEKALKIAVRRCAELDKKYSKDKAEISVKQYDFRIQSREVGEWE